MHSILSSRSYLKVQLAPCELKLIILSTVPIFYSFSLKAII